MMKVFHCTVNYYIHFSYEKWPKLVQKGMQSTARECVLRKGTEKQAVKQATGDIKTCGGGS
jgi:hypothetical protein